MDDEMTDWLVVPALCRLGAVLFDISGCCVDGAKCC